MNAILVPMVAGVLFVVLLVSPFIPMIWHLLEHCQVFLMLTTVPNARGSKKTATAVPRSSTLVPVGQIYSMNAVD